MHVSLFVVLHKKKKRAKGRATSTFKMSGPTKSIPRISICSIRNSELEKWASWSTCMHSTIWDQGIKPLKITILWDLEAKMYSSATHECNCFQFQERAAKVSAFASRDLSRTLHNGGCTKNLFSSNFKYILKFLRVISLSKQWLLDSCKFEG